MWRALRNFIIDNLLLLIWVCYSLLPKYSVCLSLYLFIFVVNVTPQCYPIPFYFSASSFQFFFYSVIIYVCTVFSIYIFFAVEMKAKKATKKINNNNTFQTSVYWGRKKKAFAHLFYGHVSSLLFGFILNYEIYESHKWQHKQYTNCMWACVWVSVSAWVWVWVRVICEREFSPNNFIIYFIRCIEFVIRTRVFYAYLG